MAGYAYPEFPYRRPRALGRVERQRVLIVGAGPVGLTAALDLAAHGVSCVVIDEDSTVSVGSRAICWSKRTLEIFDRLGVARPIVDKGVTWNTGKVFFKDTEAYQFDLQPESGHAFPAFVNLQQYYVEEFLARRAEAQPEIDLRWKHKAVAVDHRNDGVHVAIETPDGSYDIRTEWLIAADGAKSNVRRYLGLDFQGRVFEDRFLIADVKMAADFPTERRFWFDPPFHPDRSALLHRQADDIWRIDLQLGWQADPVEERKPERVIPRLKAMLGPDRPFELEWVSVYTFQCRRLERFGHGRVLFVGDAAHQVSPFGARGGNAGIQDVDNLVWKLDLVLKGLAPESLMDTYDAERIPANDENILNSTRSTDFIAPRTPASRILRDAVLTLAPQHAFARALVNSGRLSVAAFLDGSPLNAPDGDGFATPRTRPGAPAVDAPVSADGRDEWLLRHLGGRFVAMAFTNPDGTLPVEDRAALAELKMTPILVDTIEIVPPNCPFAGRHARSRILDQQGLVAQRYDGKPGTVYLFRPDQHVMGRWRRVDGSAVRAAIGRVSA
jgi:3-(3-hydroxy-phenyl)propionate hydroxylase